MNTETIDLLEESAKECIDAAERLLDTEDAEVKASIESRVEQWKSDTIERLDSESPYKNEWIALQNALNLLSFNNLTADMVMEEVRDIQYYGNPIDVEEWQRRCNDSDENGLAALKTELNNYWQSVFEEKELRWTEEEISGEKEKLLGEIEDRIDAMMELYDAIAFLPGCGYDYSSGGLYDCDVSQLRQWAKSFEDDENVRRICELLGRLTSRSVFKSTRDLRPVSYRTKVRDVNSKEELSGVEMGNRIEDLLPSELGLLNDPDCEVLFDLKYVENRLMCFSKEGYSATDKERLEEARRLESENLSGPIIFCIDTSGSMFGEPERVAKAITLYIAMKAMAEGRSCYVINFSTGITTLDVTPPRGIGELLSFLGTSFYGGTDPLPALEHAIDMTGSSRYKKADIIMISDFVMGQSPFEPIMDKIHRSKRRKCKYHSLVISDGEYRDDSGVFDYSWAYSPATGNVTDLLSMSDRVTN